MDWLQSKTAGNHNVCLHISSSVVAQGRAACAAGQVKTGHVKTRHTGQRGVQFCGDGSWTQQGTEMPPGVQGELCRSRTRKTCLISGLNSWPPKQKLKGVLPPNFPSFQKFQFLEGIKKKQHRKRKPPHNWKRSPQAVRTQEANCSCPLKWTLSETLCTLLPSAVQQSTPCKMGAIQPKLGWEDSASRGGLTRSAAKPQLTALYHWGELIWVCLPATMPRWAQGVFTTFKRCFSGIFGQNCHTALEVTGSAARPMDSRKDKQHTHESSISSGWRHGSRQHPCCQQHPWPPPPGCSSPPLPVPVQTLMLSRLVWEWWWDRSRNRSCWKHTFFFFFLGIIFDLDPFPDLAQSMTTQRLCQHKEVIWWAPKGGVGRIAAVAILATLMSL